MVLTPVRPAPPADVPPERARGRPVLAAVVSLVGLAVLVGFQLAVNRPVIEDRLHDRAVAALREVGAGSVRVSVSGRDVSLSGSVDSITRLDNALDAVRSVEGARLAGTSITLIGAAPGSGPPGSSAVAGLRVSATLAERRITLTGAVPSPSAGRLLVTAAGRSVGPGRVRDDLAAGDASARPSEGLLAVAAVLAAMDPSASATVLYADGTVQLSGRVPQRRSRDELVAAASRVLNDPTRIVDDLSIDDDALSPASLQVEKALNALEEIDFSPGSSTLGSESQRTVEEAAEILDRTPAVRIRVEAHTDASGPAGSNLRISQDRAEAVRDALIDAGVAEARIDAVGYGERRPLSGALPGADGELDDGSADDDAQGGDDPGAESDGSDQGSGDQSDGQDLDGQDPDGQDSDGRDGEGRDRRVAFEATP